jgi:Tetratricopeptide repeat
MNRRSRPPFGAPVVSGAGLALAPADDRAARAGEPLPPAIELVPAGIAAPGLTFAATDDRARQPQPEQPSAAPEPTRASAAYGLAVALNNLGNLLREQGRAREAEDALRRSVSLYEGLLARARARGDADTVVEGANPEPRAGGSAEAETVNDHKPAPAPTGAPRGG